MIKDLIARLVDTLKTIYEEYECFMYELALAAGQPPPVKKLKLASSNDSSVASPVATPPPESSNNVAITSIMHVSATVHKHTDTKAYAVAMPHSHVAPDDSDEEDTGYLSNDRKIFFLTRTKCRKCATSETTPDFHELPEYLAWNDLKTVPDGCPICQKVLFKKRSGKKTVSHEQDMDHA